MFVQDIMARPVAVAPDTPVRQVAARMLEGGASCVVVEDADGTARGLITEHDFLAHGELPYSELGGTTLLRVPLGVGAAAAVRDASGVPARRLMRPIDGILAPGDVVEKALDLMQHRGRRNLVVIESGRAVGVVSPGAFVRLAAR